MAESTASAVTRIRCVGDDILEIADGFGAAMWEKRAESQGFGICGPGRARGGEVEDRDHRYQHCIKDSIDMLAEVDVRICLYRTHVQWLPYTF